VQGRGNYIIGQERRNLINDLADGSLTQAQLAEKYGRGVSSVEQFAMRNKAEIQAVRDTINDEMHYLPYTRKAERLERLGAYIAILENDLADPKLSWSARARLSSTLSKLHHQIAEERGDLPQRATTVQLAPELIEDIKGWDASKWAKDTADGEAS